MPALYRVAVFSAIEYYGLMKRFLFVTLVLLSGCFQAYDPDLELRTVPITNNPNVIPNHGGGIPMMGGDKPY